VTWVRIDDHFPDHPKLQKVSDAAGWMFVCGLCYCARLRTDGQIAAGKVKTLTRAHRSGVLAGELVDAGLWESNDDGFVVHDYLVYQPSAEDLEARRSRATVRKRSQRMSQRDNGGDNARDTSETEGGTGTGPLTGAPLTRVGLGVGTEVGQPFQGTAELDAINEATSILSSVWPNIGQVGVENAAAGDPGADLVAAARLAATWGSDEEWKMGPAASLRAAMRKLHAESAGGRSKAERSADGVAAINRLMEAGS
jgi:hypothetical protein